MNAACESKLTILRTFLGALACTALLTVAWSATLAQPLTFQWARQSVGYAQSESLASDSSGNSYVAGVVVSATVTFDSITTTNLGDGDAFVAKYDISGKVLWVRQGGVVAGGQAIVYDIALDGAGNAYAVGIFRGDLNFGGSNVNSGDINGDYDAFVAKFNPGGALLWLRQIGGTNSDGASELAVDGTGNAYVAGQFNGVCSFDTTNLTSFGNSDAFLAKYDTDGGLVWVRQAGGVNYDYPTALATDSAGNCYMAGDFQQMIGFGTTNLTSADERNNFLAKYSASGELEWAQKEGGAGYSEIPAAAADALGNFYITGYFGSNVTFGASNVMSRGRQDGFVAKFNSNGSLQWFQSAGESNQYGFPRDVAVNSAGTVFTSGYFEASIFFGTNRLISAGGRDAFFAKYANNGALQSVGRFGGQGDDSAHCVAPYGNNTIYAAGLFTGTVNFGNTNLDGGAGAMFLTKLVPVGTPAITVDGKAAFGGSAFARGSAAVVFQTAFASGTILYTLNGSDPAISSFIYSGPITLSASATLRVIAYNADFSQSFQSDPVEVIILPTLTASTAGGGSVAIDPPSGEYFSNSTAMVTATPAPGWTFLQWLGDVSGTNPTAIVSVTRNKCVEAVFGTTLQTNMVGSGSILLRPFVGLYPFGISVKMTAVPKPGSYFAMWGTAASGTNNPLGFSVTNANPTITAVFAALSAGQHALTVIEDGRGHVTMTPRSNRFGTGTNVVLLGVPDAGQAFLGWSGDASGVQNPLTLAMNASKVITAQFTKRPQLTLVLCGGALNSEEMQLLLTGEFGEHYSIEAATNFAPPPGATVWTPIVTVTNSFGAVQVNDPFVTNRTQRFYRVVQ